MIDKETHDYNITLGVWIAFFVSGFLLVISTFKKAFFNQYATREELLFDLVVVLFIVFCLIADWVFLKKTFVKKEK